MVKFIFLSFIFHLALLVIFKLEIVDFSKSKEKAINISLSQENQALKKGKMIKISKSKLRRIIRESVKKHYDRLV